MKNISVSTEECPGRCEGMMVGVRRDLVTRRQSQEFRRLVREYEDYKCRDYSDFPFNNYKAEGCTKQKVDFFLITMISQSSSSTVLSTSSGSTSTLLFLKGSPRKGRPSFSQIDFCISRTEQPSWWTSCPPWEAPWGSSRASPSSAPWRSSTSRLRSESIS